jgi:hypothetical protein
MYVIIFFKVEHLSRIETIALQGLLRQEPKLLWFHPKIMSNKKQYVYVCIFNCLVDNKLNFTT